MEKNWSFAQADFDNWPVLSCPVPGPSRDFPGQDSPAAITSVYYVGMYIYDDGVGGFKNVQKFVDVVCEWSLIKT